MTPNSSIPSLKAPAEVMFGRKIKSVFDKLLPNPNRQSPKNFITKKRFKVGEKIFFKIYQNNKTFWESGVIDNQIGNMVYMVKGPRFIHKRQVNQLLRRYTFSNGNSSPEEVMDMVFDTFELPIPTTIPEERRSQRKRKSTDLLVVNLKQKQYY